MATRMVDVTISKLLKIPEIFGLLSPHKMADILSGTVSKGLIDNIYIIKDNIYIINDNIYIIEKVLLIEA